MLLQQQITHSNIILWLMMFIINKYLLHNISNFFYLNDWWLFNSTNEYNEYIKLCLPFDIKWIYGLAFDRRFIITGLKCLIIMYVRYVIL